MKIVARKSNQKSDCYLRTLSCTLFFFSGVSNKICVPSSKILRRFMKLAGNVFLSDVVGPVLPTA